jgi:hypothetical protein
MARVALLFAAVLLGTGCKKPLSPEEAFRRVEHAVAAGDGLELYSLLDPTTRTSVEGTYKDQRLMRTIISAKYPEAEAERELKRLEPAAEIDAPHYFAKVAQARRLFDLYRRRLGSVSGPIVQKAEGPDVVLVARQDGLPFRLHRSSEGWRLSELESEWALEKDRAVHAVKTVHENAAIYQKVGQKADQKAGQNGGQAAGPTPEAAGAP